MFNQDNVTARYRELLDEKKVTLKQAAKKMKIGYGVLTSYSHGKTRMTAESLYKIAKHTKVSTDYLLGLTDDRKGKVIQTLGLSEKTESEYKKELARLYADNKSQADKADRLVDQNNKLRSEIMSLKQNPEGLIKPLKNEIAVLKQQLETSEARVSKLIDKL